MLDNLQGNTQMDQEQVERKFGYMKLSMCKKRHEKMFRKLRHRMQIILQWQDKLDLPQVNEKEQALDNNDNKNKQQSNPSHSMSLPPISLLKNMGIRKQAVKLFKELKRANQQSQAVEKIIKKLLVFVRAQKNKTRGLEGSQQLTHSNQSEHPFSMSELQRLAMKNQEGQSSQFDQLALASALKSHLSEEQLQDKIKGNMKEVNDNKSQGGDGDIAAFKKPLTKLGRALQGLDALQTSDKQSRESSQSQPSFQQFKKNEVSNSASLSKDAQLVSFLEQKVKFLEDEQNKQTKQNQEYLMQMLQNQQKSFEQQLITMGKQSNNSQQTRNNQMATPQTTQISANQNPTSNNNLQITDNNANTIALNMPSAALPNDASRLSILQNMPAENFLVGNTAAAASNQQKNPATAVDQLNFTQEHFAPLDAINNHQGFMPAMHDWSLEPGTHQQFFENYSNLIGAKNRGPLDPSINFEANALKRNQPINFLMDSTAQLRQGDISAMKISIPDGQNNQQAVASQVQSSLWPQQNQIMLQQAAASQQLPQQQPNLFQQQQSVAASVPNAASSFLRQGANPLASQAKPTSQRISDNSMMQVLSQLRQQQQQNNLNR